MVNMMQIYAIYVIVYSDMAWKYIAVELFTEIPSGVDKPIVLYCSRQCLITA